MTSSLSRREFREINISSPVISYFGNIGLGRNESLNEIAYSLGEINSNYILNIYSNESDSQMISLLKQNPNIRFYGSVAYSEVQKKTLESDMIIIVEGFKKADVNITRYSLSTKVADSLASGVNIFAYGSIECGAIEYALETGCIETCVEKDKLTSALRSFIYSREKQRVNYEKSIEISKRNHSLENSCAIFEQVVSRTIARYR